MPWTGLFTDNCLSHVLLLVTWTPNRSCSLSLPLPASTLPLGFSFPWRIALSLIFFSYFSVTLLFVSVPPPFHISVGVSCEKAQPRTSGVLLLPLPFSSSIAEVNCFIINHWSLFVIYCKITIKKNQWKSLKTAYMPLIKLVIFWLILLT